MNLMHLHSDVGQPRIIHRDIKVANILLDNSFQAKVTSHIFRKMSDHVCLVLLLILMSIFVL